MGMTTAEREFQAIASIMAQFGISDTDDVPLSDVLRGWLVSERIERDRIAGQLESLKEAFAMHCMQCPQMLDSIQRTRSDV